MNFVPRIERPIPDIFPQLVNIGGWNQLSAEIGPGMDTLAFEVLSHCREGSALMGDTIIQKIPDRIIAQHVPIGLVSFDRLENTDLAMGFFHVFAKNFKTGSVSALF